MVMGILQMVFAFALYTAYSSIAVGTFICYYDISCERRRIDRPEDSSEQIKSAVMKSVALKTGAILGAAIVLWVFGR